MKKTYIKPLLAVEHYELTQTVATCQQKIGFNSSACVLKDPDSNDQMRDLAWGGWFTAVAENVCSATASGMDGLDGVCYHTNMNRAFTS